MIYTAEKKETDKLGMVSVIVPTYNQVDFVLETLHSVISQDYEKIELIVTDDGSIDGTVGIIKEFAEKCPKVITTIFSDTNTGIAANVNRGLKLVHGEFVAWLGGDDIMLPGKLRKQVERLRAQPDAIGCCHDAEVFESSNGFVFGLFSELMNGRKGLKEGGVEMWFDSKYYMLPSTVMFRSVAIPSHGFDTRLKYLNDWLFDVEVFRRGRCVVLQECLGRYRRHDHNVTGSVQAKRIGIEEGMMALAIVEARYPELYPLIRKRRIGYVLSAAVAAFHRKDGLMTNKFFRIALQEGAVFRVPCLWIALHIAGRFIEKQLRVLPHERSKLFTRLSKLVKV